MELKDYQARVLERFDRYLARLGEKRDDAEAFVQFQKERGKDVEIADYPREAWDSLNQEGALPIFHDASGHALVASYLTRRDGLNRSVPNVCLKIPTGGGKTLLAAAAVERVQADYFKRQTGFVLWIVPSDAIYRQTWKALANREHPYRQMLERASGGRVKLLEKQDAFTKADVENYLCVMVLMLQSSARQSKETLRMFRDSGKFTSFFPDEDDVPGNTRLLSEVPNLDVNDLAEMGYQDGIVPGSLSLKQSLGNTLRLVRPVVIIDEGHKAYSETARETLAGFNPRFILELSATPNPSGKHQSNVLVNVPGTALKDEEMIKLPINLVNIEAADWKHTLAEAHAKLKDLAKEAEKAQSAEGRYIRPILLIRVERTGKDQRDGQYVHAEDAREYMIDKCGVAEDAIRLKTSETDEIAGEELLKETSPVEVIVTKDALREGWDCPFAYVLAILSKTTANTALTQMIGRVLRQPYARATSRPALNECYVYTFDQEVGQAVESVRKGLEDEGMGDLASQLRVGTGSGTVTQKAVINRREKFRTLPVILLPRIVRRDKKAKGGYRLLDYERDILGELDWENLHFLNVEAFQAQDKTKLTRTIARVSVEAKPDGDLSFTDHLMQSVEEIPDEGLDFPYLVRQLTEVVPNPWQAARILEETLQTLQKRIDAARLYTNRMVLLGEMKRDLKLQLFGGATESGRVTGVAEQLFREKLKAGEIEFRLMSANNPDLDWRLAETLEVQITSVDHELLRRDGRPLEKQLFEKVYQRDFNTLEKNVAWYLDGADSVYWWHRIAVNQQSYGLQGWQRNRVYPDLLACIHGTREGKCRFTVLETKGDHLRGNDDTEYKRALFELLTEHLRDGVYAGELLLGEETEQMVFKMLLENNWQQELSTEVTRKSATAK